ncbi:glycosyl hydrolase family 18 protein [Parafrigoribacterium mesophilum]|uniref:chitinase n=1 Tax=Parafrigoribacterium mesophilum TaxID=433646 RepID=UPI0031FD3B00
MNRLPELESSPGENTEPPRRLSLLRVFIAVAAVCALTAGGTAGFQWWSSSTAAHASEPWFAGYADVTATPTFAFEAPATPAGRDVVLSFIVSSKDDACTPSWGTAFTLDEASVGLDLDRKIARLEQQGGAIAVSFGGQLNDELATGCTDDGRLLAAYSDVIDRYDVATIDLDIEGANLNDRAAGVRRAKAIQKLQSDRRAAGKPLAVWLTLPVAPTGLTEAGQVAVADLLTAGVDLAGVNAMVMNYGAATKPDHGLLKATTEALTSTQRQLGVLYDRAGTTLSDETLWSKVGATPMIGQNDVPAEVFGLDAATALNAFARDHGLGRVSMWSLNRDITCGPNYVDLTRVSDACSGVNQGERRFASLLAADLHGRMAPAAAKVTSAETVAPREIVDDPATSPYPVWAAESSYLEGTKVVWHRNVYVAKWWTRGDLPDNPVLNAWETPWSLIGPVLPGERPIKVPTLPPGTYPEWTGTAVYEKGVRVLQDGIPFEAKWWNQAESPEAASANPDSSPWAPLTADQIRQVDNDG